MLLKPLGEFFGFPGRNAQTGFIRPASALSSSSMSASKEISDGCSGRVLNEPEPHASVNSGRINHSPFTY